jgi:hypothetical protein
VNWNKPRQILTANSHNRFKLTLSFTRKLPLARCEAAPINIPDSRFCCDGTWSLCLEVGGLGRADSKSASAIQQALSDKLAPKSRDPTTNAPNSSTSFFNFTGPDGPHVTVGTGRCQKTTNQPRQYFEVQYSERQFVPTA